MFRYDRVCNFYPEKMWGTPNTFIFAMQELRGKKTMQTDCEKLGFRFFGLIGGHEMKKLSFFFVCLDMIEFVIIIPKKKEW